MVDDRGTRMDWPKLTAYLKDAPGDLILTFVEVERICGGSLPASKEYPAFWSNSSSYAKHWVRAGYRVSRARCLPDQVRFLRTRAPSTASPPAPRSSGAPDGMRQPSPAALADVVLVGCVKTKRSTASEARDLYVSSLFQRRRAYAERAGVRWFILSAEYGLVAPTEFISPYDTYLPDLDPAYRRVWGEWCATRLQHLVGNLSGRAVEIHASEPYVSAIAPHLTAKGARLRVPLEGMRQGEQLAWYDSSESATRTTDAGDLTDEFEGVQYGRPVNPQAVSDVLLQFRRIQMDDAKAEPLGGRGAAGQLLASDPFAFLVAVIFDEGIVAERAWEAPLELKRRLGHLDPATLRHERLEVTEAVSRRPALHRYVELIPEAICMAAARVCDVYGGDASRIWQDGTTVREVDRRLREFHRIGQKKAAMAVEILLTKFDADLVGLDDTDIAYDVQVRRVFLRSGLADRDDPRAMIDAARRLQPERPGYIDAAAWHIGREWCRPAYPVCSACPLDAVCAKRTWHRP